jgi:hypothetical protein
VQFLPQNITTISGSYNNAMVDMNGDYLDDIVSVSSDNILIHFQDTGGLFSVQNFPTTNATFQPSWSIAMGDINEDGYNDLLYGGGNGVTFMKSNGLGTGYIQSSGNQYVFSQRSNFVDINNDGHLDAFAQLFPLHLFGFNDRESLVQALSQGSTVQGHHQQSC